MRTAKEQHGGSEDDRRIADRDFELRDDMNERAEVPDYRTVDRDGSGVAHRVRRHGARHQTHECWPGLQFHKWFNGGQSRAIFMMAHSRDGDSNSSYQAEARPDLKGASFLFASSIWIISPRPPCFTYCTWERVF